jgi:hypothetical protein
MKKDYEPLPPDVDTHLQILVAKLLNKDPTRRPSTWDLAADPVIRQYIDEFVTKHDCFDQVSQVLDSIP